MDMDPRVRRCGNTHVSRLFLACEVPQLGGQVTGFILRASVLHFGIAVTHSSNGLNAEVAQFMLF
jgi:hypothetical protein